MDTLITLFQPVVKAVLKHRFILFYGIPIECTHIFFVSHFYSSLGKSIKEKAGFPLPFNQAFMPSSSLNFWAIRKPSNVNLIESDSQSPSTSKLAIVPESILQF